MKESEVSGSGRITSSRPQPPQPINLTIINEASTEASIEVEGIMFLPLQLLLSFFISGHGTATKDQIAAAIADDDILEYRLGNY
eukprot:scaffold43971_cov80-Cyclotella_meneghiniana.AAC.2